MASEFKLTRYIYWGMRGVVRVATIPVRGLKEGPAKARIRKFILNFQHSLPTEFVVNKGDTVVQIGTPRPKTMARFRRAVGSEGRLVIVEAMPENQDRLAKAIAEYGFDNVTLIRAAACNENKQGELAISPYIGDHKIDLDHIDMDNDLRPGNAQMEHIPVEFVRLDDELPRHGVETIDLLSVTVNGAEGEVLKGARDTLSRSPAGTRVYAKGHALDKSGQPLHLETQAIMQSIGYQTKITKGEPSSTKDTKWLWRAGDLFAWKANAA
ncbi:MAG: FkbM family methyltransferase [Erythrobacter sp.]